VVKTQKKIGKVTCFYFLGEHMTYEECLRNSGSILHSSSDIEFFVTVKAKASYSICGKGKATGDWLCQKVTGLLFVQSQEVSCLLSLLFVVTLILQYYEGVYPV